MVVLPVCSPAPWLGQRGAIDDVEVDISFGLPAFTIVSCPIRRCKIQGAGARRDSLLGLRLPDPADHREAGASGFREGGADVANGSPSKHLRLCIWAEPCPLPAADASRQGVLKRRDQTC